MKIVKKIGIILIIISVLLSITYNKSFAAAEEDKKEAIDEIVKVIDAEIQSYDSGDKNDVDLLNSNLSSQESQYKMQKIALMLVEKLEEYKEKGIEITADDIGEQWPNLVKNKDTAWYQVLNLAKNSKKETLEEQVQNPTESADKKAELEKEINNLYDKGLKLLTDSELEELNNLLEEYKTSYPSEWELPTNEIHVKVGNSVANEIYRRENSMSGTLGQQTGSTTHTPDEIIDDANSFLQAGTETTINGDNLTSASSTLYNILLSVGIFLAVAIGVFLGAKFMLSAAEDKAKVKEALIPYIAGCVVIFSAFIIWKLAVTLLGAI